MRLFFPISPASFFEKTADRNPAYYPGYTTGPAFFAVAKTRFLLAQKWAHFGFPILVFAQNGRIRTLFELRAKIGNLGKAVIFSPGFFCQRQKRLLFVVWNVVRNLLKFGAVFGEKCPGGIFIKVESVLFSAVFGRKKGGIELAEKEHHLACGMHLCGKCSWSVLVFGLLFLIAGLGLWAGAPA